MAVQALLASANKLVLADRYVAALAAAIHRNSAPSALALGMDLGAFRQVPPHGARLLLRQLHFAAPAFR